MKNFQVSKRSTNNRVAARCGSMLFLLALLVYGGCSSDNGDGEQVHYYNPVWTADNRAAVFGVFRGTSADDPSTSSLLCVPDTNGRQLEFSVAPMYTLRGRHWIDPVSGALAFAQSGINFYSVPVYPGQTTSSLLGVYTPTLGNRQPYVMAFNASGGSFIWAGNTNGALAIVHVEYATQPWVPTKETVLLDSITTTSALDIIFTSQSTFAVRFSDGKIRQYDFSKRLIREYSVVPFFANNLWQYHLAFYNASGSPARIYAAQQNGFVELILDSLGVKPLVEGALVNYDVNEATRSMIYETSSFDIWLATQEAQPLARLVPHNGMGRFSQDGYFLAAVGKATNEKDTVTVRRIRE
jgi:hypothetical protein